MKIPLFLLLTLLAVWPARAQHSPEIVTFTELSLRSLVRHDGALVLSADARAVNGTARPGQLFRLAGGRWIRVPGPPAPVTALAVHDGELLAGLEVFGSRGSLIHVLRGGTWTPQGLAAGPYRKVAALEDHGGETWALVTDVVGLPVDIYRLRDGVWSPTGFSVEGFPHHGFDLVSYGGYLHVGGAFLFPDDLTTGHLARWTGDRWEAVGDGLSGPVRDLEVHRGKLWVGGWFDRAGDLRTWGLAAWDGVAWSEPGSPRSRVRQEVSSLGSLGEELVLGARHDASWSTALWFRDLWSVFPDPTVSEIAVVGTRIYGVLARSEALDLGIFDPSRRTWRSLGGSLSPVPVAAHRVFPVPTRTRVTLEWTRSGVSRVEIFDTQGRLVRFSRVANHQDSEDVARWIWDLRDACGRRVAPGVYFSRVSGMDTANTQKVIVLP